MITNPSALGAALIVSGITALPGCTRLGNPHPIVALAAANRAVVQASFDRWRAGTGGPFELLAPEAEWTIVGSSPRSKTYASRQAFLDEVIEPFNARLAAPLVPAVRHISADGDVVVVLFDAAAPARDGQPYRNTYTWHLWMRESRIVRAIAFFDTRLFDEFWSRVAPGQ